VNVGCVSADVSAFPEPLTRRVLLAAGGLTLLSACTKGTAEVAAPLPISTTTVPTPRAASTTPRDPDGDITPPASPTNNPNVTSTEGAASYGSPQFYVHDGPKVIAITFDDGPDPVYTPQILRLLARYEIIATFNMIGRSVARQPAVVREVAAAGHLLSNHTYTHGDMQHRTATQVRREISRTSEVMHATTGTTPTHFRAPYGAWSSTVLNVCQEYQLRPLDWSVDPRDWSRPGTSHIISTIMAHTRTGSIILDHDGGGDRSQTVAALSIALPRLLDGGYRFTTP
jgi:peptidoglycan/xylan/chitin deacetylase (PgdA/CDA1 family)